MNTLSPLNYKPRRRAMRLVDHDYSSPGAYFVTICTLGRACLFGSVRDGLIFSNAFGQVVHECWRTLPSHYPHIALDAFVVMPNHVHGILWLTEATQTGKHHSLTEIIRGFKTFSAHRVNVLRRTPAMSLWQRSYYEHIVRNEASLTTIREYIETNPLRWELDKENPANIFRPPP